MYKLYIILLVMLVVSSEMATYPARSPKIYNALISSDANLQPSHAYPLVEPVLRTTALGVAFPPLLVQQMTQHNQDSGQLVEFRETTGMQITVPVAKPAPLPTELPASVITAQNFQPSNVANFDHYSSLYPLTFDLNNLPHQTNAIKLPIRQPMSFYQPFDQNPQQPPLYVNHLIQQQQLQIQQKESLQEQQTRAIEIELHSNKPLRESSQVPPVRPHSDQAVQNAPPIADAHNYLSRPSKTLSPSGLGIGVNFNKNPDIPDVPPPPLPISNVKAQKTM